MNALKGLSAKDIAEKYAGRDVHVQKTYMGNSFDFVGRIVGYGTGTNGVVVTPGTDHVTEDSMARATWGLKKGEFDRGAYASLVTFVSPVQAHEWIVAVEVQDLDALDDPTKPIGKNPCGEINLAKDHGACELPPPAPAPVVMKEAATRGPCYLCGTGSVPMTSRGVRTCERCKAKYFELDPSHVQ